MRILRHGGFTIVEVLVVVGVIGLLAGLLFPILRNIREHTGQTRCASNLRQLGVATLNYLAVNRDHLPQQAIPNPFGAGEVISPFLFAGVRGEMPYYGVSDFGINERPLNPFLCDGQQLEEELDIFRCPLDRGQPAQSIGPLSLPDVDTCYKYLGTSYTTNNTTLEGCPTLIPSATGAKPGGKMPHIDDPTFTWMIADLNIYNYSLAGDRGQRWHFRDTICNMCFVDGHVAQEIEIPQSTWGADGFIEQNTTQNYTFLPTRDWMSRCGQ